MANWTPEQFEEVKKCRKSFRYFAEKYLQIMHPKLGLLPFKLYPFQERMVKEFEVHTYCILKKFRQAGATTTTVMWLLWKCLFYNDQRIMFLSKTDREARYVGKMVANAKEKLPEFLKPTMNNDNDHEKEFADTDSVMWFFTPSAARSRSLTYLVIDEAAFIPKMDEAWAAIYPTLSTGGNCIVVSTVNGVGGTGGWYYQTYTEAQDKKNDFYIVDIKWQEHPEYNNPEWERRARANMSVKKFSQEYDGNFLSSGETYISPDVIKEFKELCINPERKTLGEWDSMPEDIHNTDNPMFLNRDYVPGAMWVWDNPKPGKEYIITADAAEGVGDEGDNCAFVVMDMSNLQQVAEFYSNTIPTYKFSQVLAQVGSLYNTALIAVENSMGPGQAVCERLQHSLRYDNLYFTQGNTRDKAGLNMNKVTRPICMESLQTCMLNRIVGIKSVRVIRELETFIYNKAKQRPEAQKGKHDDLVICISAALYVCNVMGREMPMIPTKNKEEDVDLITKALNNEEYQKLKEELEVGIQVDLLEEPIDIEIDLLPKIMFDRPRRSQDSLLKEFGW
jgi:hypothetical protein